MLNTWKLNEAWSIKGYVHFKAYIPRRLPENFTKSYTSTKSFETAPFPLSCWYFFPPFKYSETRNKSDKLVVEKIFYWVLVILYLLILPIIKIVCSMPYFSNGVFIELICIGRVLWGHQFFLMRQYVFQFCRLAAFKFCLLFCLFLLIFLPLNYLNIYPYFVSIWIHYLVGIYYLKLCDTQIFPFFTSLTTPKLPGRLLHYLLKIFLHWF